MGCSNDKDDSFQQLQDFTITLNVDANHSFGNFPQSAKAFLSDQDGEILASGDLLPGQTTILMASVEDASILDLTYLIYNYNNDFNVKVYSMETFTNVQQGTYNLGPKNEIEDTYDEIYIHLTNTGYPCEAVATPSGQGTFGPENGGYFNWQANLVGSPKSDFYMAFKSPNDPLNHYLWLEDVTEGAIFNMDYNTLPKIQNTVNTALPANDNVGYQIFGLVENDANNIHHLVADGNFINGTASLTSAVPQNVFDQFLTEISYSNANNHFFHQSRTSSIPTEIPATTLNLTVNNPSPQNFNMDLVGNGILYNASFTNANAAGSLFFTNSIYGEAAPTVSFSKENLRLNIQALYPELSQFPTVSLRAASVSKYSAINSYQDILAYKIERQRFEVPDLNGSFEQITKDF